MSTRTGPAWLPAFLNEGSYFGHCPCHPATSKNEMNFFCTHCQGSALCHQCVNTDHSGHKNCVLQVVRSSYCNAVRVADINKLINLSDIQPYKINNKHIVFLNARPQNGFQKGVSDTCEACNRALLDPVRFCSIGCKLNAVSSDTSVTLSIPGAKGEKCVESAPKQEQGDPLPSNVARKRVTNSMDESLCESASASKKRPREEESHYTTPVWLVGRQFFLPDNWRKSKRKSFPIPSATASGGQMEWRTFLAINGILT